MALDATSRAALHGLTRREKLGMGAAGKRLTPTVLTEVAETIEACRGDFDGADLATELTAAALQAARGAEKNGLDGEQIIRQVRRALADALSELRRL